MNLHVYIGMVIIPVTIQHVYGKWPGVVAAIVVALMLHRASAE